MTSLLLEPHQDDAILFASYLCLTHRPEVVTVLGDARNQPGVTKEMRDRENANAFRYLYDEGVIWPASWPHRDDSPDWDDVEFDLRSLETTRHSWNTPARYEQVFAPYPEPKGHEQHNRIGELAHEIFRGRVTYYTTYQYGGPRTTGDPVPYEREWVQRKLRALACFESQILHGPVRFFTMGLDEYTRQP